MTETPPATRPWPALSLGEAHALLTRPGSPFEMEDRTVHGVDLRVWKHTPATLRDVFQAAGKFAERDFVVYEDERVTFDAFARASAVVAEALVAAGIRKGDRVAIAMRNLPEWPVAFFGAVLAGAIATPLNSWWTGPELAYGLADSGARIAIVDQDRLARIGPHLGECPALDLIFVSRGDGAGGKVRRLADLLGPVSAWADLPHRPLPDVPLGPDDDVTILYTSGTTGKPKGALGTHRNTITALPAALFSAARNCLRRGEPIAAPDPGVQRANLLAVPFFHATGLQAILCPSLWNGSKIVLMRRWDAERAMQLIERERCTNCGGVPTVAWQIIEHPRRANYDLSSLETVSYGGAPGSAELVRSIKRTFAAAAPGLGWGMTETSATFTTHSAEDYLARPESSGPALPVCDMRIVDESGRTLPAGERGELLVKGPNVVRGYWNKPEATAETVVDGWLKTGDIAWIDDEGFLFIVDRKKDMLIRGGENIYCIEVESALYEHPAVMDAALIGLPHPTLGEEPAAVVSLKPGASTDEAQIKTFLASRLAAFKIPVAVRFQTGMLPRNANGKIMKGELRTLFAARPQDAETESSHG
ncbi:MAG: AMP-binding protein [Hyphomicrobiaceae bacterium]